MKTTEVKEILSHIISTISNDPSDFFAKSIKGLYKESKTII
ncbi:hypothetical protein [Pelosinus sp. sgz500959]